MGHMLVSLALFYLAKGDKANNMALQRVKYMNKKIKNLLGGSLAFAALSTLCCILPLLGAAFGASFLVVAVKIEKFRWVFVGLAVLLLAVTGYLFVRKQTREKEKLCRSGHRKTWLVGIVILAVIALILLPYFLGACA